MAWVRVVRSGGFAGMTRSGQAEVPDHLVRACPWDAPIAAQRGADRYIYEISVTNGPVVTLPESCLADPWRALIEYVLTSGDDAK
jgi:hypothetical protein